MPVVNSAGKSSLTTDMKIYSTNLHVRLNNMNTKWWTATK